MVGCFRLTSIHGPIRPQADKFLARTTHSAKEYRSSVDIAFITEHIDGGSFADGRVVIARTCPGRECDECRSFLGGIGSGAHDDEYSNTIDNYAFRHHVKPGITGWAQTHGFCGETVDVAAMKKRIQLDLWYINNWSLWLDFRVFTCFREPRK